MENLVVNLIFLAVFVVLSGMVWESVHYTTERKAQHKNNKRTNND